MVLENLVNREWQFVHSVRTKHYGDSSENGVLAEELKHRFRAEDLNDWSHLVKFRLLHVSYEAIF